MNTSIISLLLIACISGSYAHISAGKCLENPIIKDFDPAKYAGNWYEIIHYPAIFEDNIKCVVATYKALNSTALSVHNFAVSIKNGENTTTDGYAVIQDLTKPNLISVFFPIHGTEPQPYNVWMTDYSTYALVYSCKPVIPGLVKFETIWVLGRQNTMDQGLVDKFLSYYKASGVDISVFKQSDQTNCTY